MIFCIKVNEKPYIIVETKAANLNADARIEFEKHSDKFKKFYSVS